jgi:cob(I)alamin adenosyltransferase
MPNEFILPGDTVASAALALARTVTRRAERRVVKLTHEGELQNITIMQYLNRLSSLLFVLEIYENQAAGNSAPTLAKWQAQE